jgi:hypothetical protein
MIYMIWGRLLTLATAVGADFVTIYEVHGEECNEAIFDEKDEQYIPSHVTDGMSRGKCSEQGYSSRTSAERVFFPFASSPVTFTRIRKTPLEAAALKAITFLTAPFWSLAGGVRSSAHPKPAMKRAVVPTSMSGASKSEDNWVLRRIAANLGRRNFLAYGTAALAAGCGAQPANADEPVRRFLSIGDLHGDFKHSFELLKSLGVMDADGHWAGGRSVLVQTGDVVDRGDNAKELYEMLFRLQDEAPKSGGEVVLLLGNHELMNMMGDFRYATPKDIMMLGGSPMGRAQAFGPLGWPGQRLRERNQVVSVIGKEHGLDEPVLYVHAGLLPAVAELSAPTSEAFNSLFKTSLFNRTAQEMPNDFALFSLLGGDGPFWTRRLATDNDEGVCSELASTLSRFGASRMVVGHTPQIDGRIHHRCDGRLVLADTLISDAYTGVSNPSAVEVLPSGQAFAVYPVLGGLRCVELPKVGSSPQPAASPVIV